MEKTLKPYNPKELQRTHPLANLLEGWFFRCEEISAGRYQVEGTDICGRTVAATGIDPDELLKRCVADAKAISSEKTPNDSTLKITITLSQSEALVLFEFLSRFSDSEKLTIEHAAERSVLWDICASLEKSLAEPLSKDYQALLQMARDSVTTEE
jgi:hypothetical protein